MEQGHAYCIYPCSDRILCADTVCSSHGKKADRGAANIGAITAFLLSNIASQPLTNANVPLLYAIVPITVILCLEIIFSFWTIKSAAAKSLLEGKPSIVIKNGVIDQREMVDWGFWSFWLAVITSSPAPASLFLSVCKVPRAF